MKDYKKLKSVFIDDPEMLDRLDKQEQADLLREISSKKVSLDGIEQIKGEQGEQGEKGDKGDDGKDGIDGKDGEKGETGISGNDGRDGFDGKNGKDGKDGQDGSPDSPTEVRDKLASLKGNERLDISSIKNGEALASLASKASKKFDMNDQRWNGSGTFITVSTTAPSNPYLNQLWFDIS